MPLLVATIREISGYSSANSATALPSQALPNSIGMLTRSVPRVPDCSSSISYSRFLDLSINPLRIVEKARTY